MSTFTIDNIDLDQGRKEDEPRIPGQAHVTFTITFDDKETHTETRCDLNYNNSGLEHRPSLQEELIEYTKQMTAAHEAEKEAMKLNGNDKLVGKKIKV